MTDKNPAFTELHFGHLDASQEAADEPELLIEGFYDYRDAAYGISVRQIWLLLGPKGSGKTAVLEYLKLTWEPRPDRFFTHWDLGGFPVNDVTQIQMGQSGGGSRSQSAWEFLLLLRVIESLAADNGRTAPRSFEKMLAALKAGGFLSGDWLSRVSRWSGSTLKFDAKLLGGETRFDAHNVTPLEVSAYLREQISLVTTDSQHIIALDGLDTFFFEAEDEWTSLAGLMQGLHALNKLFRTHNLPVSLVAAVRSDVFDVLPGSEMNKLKPHAVHLDWHANGIGAKNHLWTLLTRKVAVGRPQIKNILTAYFAGSVNIGPHTDMPEYLLDNTRLLPRDVIALMTHLQRTYRGDRQITENAARKAVRTYSEEYFVGEMFDNLAGVLPAGRARAVNSFKDALRTAPSRVFEFEYMLQELEGELSPLETKLLLRQLFETGGIGTLRNGYTNFVFRKVSGAGFTTRDKFLLHDALTRAWGRSWR